MTGRRSPTARAPRPASIRPAGWDVLGRWSRARAPWNELAAVLLADGVAARRPAAGLFVPGRIELFGKHTDYAGGRSLVAATERGLRLLVAPRRDSRLHWRDLGCGVEVDFDAARAEERSGHWSNYLRIPARRLCADFGALERGVDVAMTSDLPAAAGLSSSSALVVAAFLALDAASSVSAAPAYGAEIRDRSGLAGYLGAVENGLPFAGLGAAAGVGTFGGSEDHAAIVGSRRGRLRLYGYCPVRLECEIELPRGWRFVVASSGVHARKTGAARELYNRLAVLADEGARAWRRSTGDAAPHLGAALEAAGSAAALSSAVEAGLEGEGERAAGSPPEIRNRVRQFAEESGSLTPAAAAAFGSGDGEALGRLARRSHQLAEELLANQVAETSALVRLAGASGAIAASAFGAGFGGAVWALVDSARAADVVSRWRTAYRREFPERAAASRFFATGAAGGARWLSAAACERAGGPSRGGAAA